MEALGNPESARTFPAVAGDMLKTPAKDPTRAPRVAWCTDHLGGKAIGSVTTADSRPLLEGYAKGHTHATANRLRAAVSSVSDHAERRGWIDRILGGKLGK